MIEIKEFEKLTSGYTALVEHTPSWFSRVFMGKAPAVHRYISHGGVRWFNEETGEELDLVFSGLRDNLDSMADFIEVQSRVCR